jgi:hypothetical protein
MNRYSVSKCNGGKERPRKSVAQSYIRAFLNSNATESKERRKAEQEAT